MILCGVLVGCALNNTRVDIVEGAPTSFITVEQGGCYRIMYHESTKVMYSMSLGHYNMGSLTLLVNPDGTPMLWEG